MKTVSLTNETRDIVMDTLRSINGTVSAIHIDTKCIYLPYFAPSIVSFSLFIRIFYPVILFYL